MSPAGSWEAIPSDHNSIDDIVAAHDALQILASLPQRQRTDLTLLVASYSYTEIAKITGRRTYTNVNKHIARHAPASGSPGPAHVARALALGARSSAVPQSGRSLAERSLMEEGVDEVEGSRRARWLVSSRSCVSRSRLATRPPALGFPASTGRLLLLRRRRGRAGRQDSRSEPAGQGLTAT